jgi:hypothetical protein
MRRGQDRPPNEGGYTSIEGCPGLRRVGAGAACARSGGQRNESQDGREPDGYALCAPPHDSLVGVQRFRYSVSII